MESRNIDFSFGQFIYGISSVEGQIFPLRFWKRDLEERGYLLANRIIGGDTLLRVICDGLLQLILKGELLLQLTNADAATAIRYGLGFGRAIGGLPNAFAVQEPAIVECLRYFIPFRFVVENLLQSIIACSKPQMVGYLMEYLVSFALVSNYSGLDPSTVINKPVSQNLSFTDESQVCLPDALCGPDIIYKCRDTMTIYIVQVKFLKSISKQEIASAYHTTNHERFYCKRRTGEVLRGFEARRQQFLESLKILQDNGFSLQQMLFIHTGERNIPQTEGALIISKANSPDFFNKIGPGIWEYLDTIRSRF
jgi:hypothetical protein